MATDHRDPQPAQTPLAHTRGTRRLSGPRPAPAVTTNEDATPIRDNRTTLTPTFARRPPWDQQTLLIAQALGKEAAGRKLIDGIKASFAKAAAEHPEFSGKTATFSQGGFYNGLIYVYPAGLNTEFLTYLGLTINPKLNPLIKREGEQVEVSTERLDVLDADVAVFATEEPKAVGELLDVKTFAKLPVVAEHRSVYTDATLAGAIYFTSPLSLPYVLEHLTPQLAKALAGAAPQREPQGQR